METAQPLKAACSTAWTVLTVKEVLRQTNALLVKSGKESELFLFQQISVVPCVTVKSLAATSLWPLSELACSVVPNSGNTGQFSPL